MDLDIKGLKKKIKDHFGSISDEELAQNAIRAGIATYTDLKLNFLEEGPQKAYQARPIIEAGNEANSGRLRILTGPVRQYYTSAVFGLEEISGGPAGNRSLGGVAVVGVIRNNYQGGGGVIQPSCPIDPGGANSSSSTENSLLRELCL